MKYLSVKIILLGLLSASLHAQSTVPGTWTLYPQQAQTLQASVQPPINADGSSVWSAKSTIPIQLDLQQSLGPVMFSSYEATGTVSFLDFAFSNTVTIDQLSNLSAVYQFSSGNCHAGALRWSINLDGGYSAGGDTVYVYYGNVPAPFNDCTSSATSGSNNNLNNQSGLNLLASNFQTDPRYEIKSNGPTYLPYATVLAAESGKSVTDVTLVLDAGFAGDQVLTTGYPMNVTVGLTDGTTATFIPRPSAATTVCAAQPATIQISKLGAGGSYSVDETNYSAPADQGSSFRIDGCKYMYNISGKSLGTGQYQVDAIINGTPVYQTPPGTIFVIK
jgi:hypothetical protein